LLVCHGITIVCCLLLPQRCFQHFFVAAALFLVAVMFLFLVAVALFFCFWLPQCCFCKKKFLVAAALFLFLVAAALFLLQQCCLGLPGIVFDVLGCHSIVLVAMALLVLQQFFGSENC